MSRTAIDKNSGYEIAIIPMPNVLISQGAGTTKDNVQPLPTALLNGSHMGYKAMDFCDSSRILYAPFSLKCIKHEKMGNAYFSFFRSKNKVICSDGSTTYVSLVCIHGGPNIPVVATDKNGNKYNTNLAT